MQAMWPNSLSIRKKIVNIRDSFFIFLWKQIACHKNKMEFIKWKLTIIDFKEIFPPLYARRRYVTCVRNNLCYAYLWKIIMRTAYFLAEPCQRSHFFASHFIRGNTCAAIVTTTFTLHYICRSSIFKCSLIENLEQSKLKI